MDIVKVLLVAGGAAIVWHGFEEHKVSRGTTAEAIDVKLADIEAGKISDNNHLKIGKHWALHTETIYSYSQSKYDTGEPGPNTSISYAFYPIISHSHEHLKEVYAYWAKKEADPNFQGAAPTVRSFSVLVKTNRFDKLRDLPTDDKEVDSIKGLVVNRIRTLDDDEKKLISQSFPSVNLDKVLILDDGREPSSATASWAFMIGGVLLVLTGIGLTLYGWINGSDDEPIAGTENAAPRNST